MNLADIASQRLLQHGGLLLHSQHPERERIELQNWLHSLGLQGGLQIHRLSTQTEAGPLLCQLAPADRLQLLPLHDTLQLHQRWPQREGRGQALTLTQEIVLALLAAPSPLHFASLADLQSQVRVREHMAHAAARTALAFDNTLAAERPEAFWHYDDEHGFLLRPGCDLIEAIVAATQPEATGRLYDFSCYRASEYVILLGIAQELRQHHPAMYQQLQSLCQRHAIRSGQFHEVFLVEYGSLQQPLPARYCVPGDRLWFRNPDAHSSDIEGYEGSWVIYMGGGLFSNFWRRDQPFTLEGKCLEIFHWRDGTCTDAQGQLAMDEARVAQAVQATAQNADQVQQVLERMMRLRDPQGVYAQGGCLDATREFPKSVCPSACQLQLPDIG